MNAITRFDPFREMMTMSRAMDQLLRGGYFAPEGVPQPLSMPMDVYETDDAYEVEVSLPGVDPEDVEISLDENTLTIRGEIREEQEEEGKTYHLRERRAGVFVRSITLPTAINADAIEARYEDGVLRLRLPKAEGTKPKRIQIQSGKAPKTIEGKARQPGTQQTNQPAKESRS